MVCKPEVKKGQFHIQKKYEVKGTNNTRNNGPKNNNNKGPNNNNKRNAKQRKDKKNSKSKHHHQQKYKYQKSDKPHDAPMQKRDIYFALDCEMVGVGHDGRESALARVTIVNWDNEVVLDTFVKVAVPVTNYRTHISGITRQDLESNNAMNIDDCRCRVQSILKGKILIGHGLENDLCVLGLNHPWCDIRDTAYYGPYMAVRKSSPLPTSSSSSSSSNENVINYPRKLRDLAWEKLHKVIQAEGKPHSSEEDAIAALDLYKASRDEWEKMLSVKVMKLNEIETSMEKQRAEQFQKHRQSPVRDMGYISGGNVVNSMQQQQREYRPQPIHGNTHFHHGQQRPQHYQHYRQQGIERTFPSLSQQTSNPSRIEPNEGLINTSFPNKISTWSYSHLPIRGDLNATRSVYSMQA